MYNAVKNPFVLLALPLAISSQVQAQGEASQILLEEIIVTASKRATALNDTPIAVTAFNADMIEKLNVTNPFNYEKLVPSLTFQQSPNRLSIRGVGRFSNSLGVSPGVAIYNDGIYTAEAASLSTQPINIARSEILRGPQGTLYGRNTTGGAVNIISRRPSAEFEGDFRVKVGDYDLVQYAAVVSGPITDSLRYKVHYIDTERDGLQDNLYNGPGSSGDDFRETSSEYYEAQIEWDITENLSLWAEYGRLDYNFTNGISWAQDDYVCDVFWAGLGRSAQALECSDGNTERPGRDDPREGALNNHGKQDLDSNNNWTARLTWDMGEMELSYLFGYVEYKWDSKTDFDGTTNDEYRVWLDVGQYQEQTTHELQLYSEFEGKFNFIAGLYYFEDENEQPYNINSDWATFQTIWDGGAQFWDNPLGVIYFQNGVIDNESWAAFGEIDYDFTDELTLTLGARYSEDDFKGGEVQLQYYDLCQEFFACIPGVNPYGQAPYAFDASQDQFAGDPTRYVDTIDAWHEHDYDNVTWKAALAYRPEDMGLFWGSVSTGYKMGGVRLGALQAFYSQSAGFLGSDGTFDEEEMIAYELGWKGDLFDNRMFVEAVVFYNDYDDLQQLRSFQTPPPGSITLSEVVNIDTEMYGFELFNTWSITDNFRTLLTYSYNHAEYSEDVFFRNRDFGERDEDGNIIPENVDGNTLALTPEHKASLSAIYVWPSQIGEFTFSTTYSYMDERFFDPGNHNSEDSYEILDATVSWTHTSGRYQILASATNLTDEENFNTHSCSVPSGATYGTPNWQFTCSGNPIDQRLWEVQFMLKI